MEAGILPVPETGGTINGGDILMKREAERGGSEDEICFVVHVLTKFPETCSLPFYSGTTSKCLGSNIRMQEPLQDFVHLVRCNVGGEAGTATTKYCHTGMPSVRSVSHPQKRASQWSVMIHGLG